jgi:hypothetical protein
MHLRLLCSVFGMHTPLIVGLPGSCDMPSKQQLSCLCPESSVGVLLSCALSSKVQDQDVQGRPSMQEALLLL